MKNIKGLREALGMTQQELATELNVGRTTVVMWENENSKPKTEMLPKIAKALKCEIADLFS